MVREREECHWAEAALHTASSGLKNEAEVLQRLRREREGFTQSGPKQGPAQRLRFVARTFGGGAASTG